jgi:glycosyltransferase involved in cell wall biosynthesis
VLLAKLLPGTGSVDKLHSEVGSLVVRDGTYFGTGWVFHEEKAIREVRLLVRFANGKSQSIAASIGKPRDDVAASFSAFATAKHSGFFLLGSCNQEPNNFSNLFLRVTLEDDSVAELHVPQACIKSFGRDDIAAGGMSMHQFVTGVKRSLYFVKRFQLASLLAKIRRYFGNRPTSILEKGEDVRKILDASELRNIVLVIDHDLGGGANHYRERLVTEKINEGATVLIFSYYVATLSYVLMVRTIQRSERFAIPGFDFLLELAEQLEIKEIIYNTGASFSRPEKLAPLIVELKNRYNLRLVLLVHDFFMVCPSHYLLDDAGGYCGIPEIGRCQACLANNQQEFSSLYRSRDIVQWRAAWGAVIRVADEIRTFSDSSLKLLQKAYPALDSSRVIVAPHTVTYLTHGNINPSYTASLRIGVVGQIGYHKGAKIVRDLACEIKARGLNIQIVVIGTIEAQCEPSVVSETGPYRHDKLPELIENAGVNIMLFPSIWPETFSYVVQEQVELGLPVACFDLGAPAERLRSYDKGMIMKETTASAILDDLISFHQRIYTAH